MNPSNSTTKTGFSKAGFGCCSFWNVCNMGKGACYYQESDLEVKNYCRCYQRKHSKNVKPVTKKIVKQPVQQDLFSSSDSKEEKKISNRDEMTQLSLF
ncbi:hypothetical protein [Bacillus sp. FJAT-29937]|uniref:hypothetical protein n=1 Tax=Bacillus sp. FJAT-29937 TaxID=1720553 RepID=UPI00082F7BC6|nr:hypothetical protein [Bacillus sp. FJAT-29937]